MKLAGTASRAAADDAVAEALRQLRANVEGTVDDSPRRRAEYSSDASNYRVVPAAVVFPRTTDDLVTCVDVARSTRVPLTVRGAGTSVAGNAVGRGIVADTSRYLDRIVDLDPTNRVAVVEPGVILGSLQRAAAPHGLRFGPDPSTQNRCTLGGMIGNNACGPRAVAWGRTADNVEALDVVDGHGRRLALNTGWDAVPGLAGLVTGRLDVLRTELGRFTRQVSGYSLEHLLPERGRRVARAFVGTEGTCGVVLSATLRLVLVPSATALVALGYPDLPAAAEASLHLIPLHPTAVEGLDARLVDAVRDRPGDHEIPEVPVGGGLLFVEVAGDTRAEIQAAAGAVVAAAGTTAVRIVTDAAEARALWRIRADGVGLAGRTPAGEAAWPGWEDAAVPPARLSAYLREMETLKTEYRITGLSYGHFGDGCIHTRLDLPIDDADRFRDFLTGAARLVAGHGGSLSGEHGDGRARSELLPVMYSPAALTTFAEFKNLFDPDDVLNPGIVVTPESVTADLRLATTRPLAAAKFSLAEDRGDLGRAVHRCVGVGSCRADSSGFMCPSFLATRDEKDSTRGRARVLQEVLDGGLLPAAWRSDGVAESLDLCLSCKACASDCPAGVDMATYKSETLYRRYRRRLRPVSHYSLGWLPRWLRLAERTPRVLNRLGAIPRLRRAAFRAAGIDTRRSAPRLSTPSFRRSRRPPSVEQPTAVLFVDCFSNALAAEVPDAALRVLEAAGVPALISERVCCGLTWITTGQLDAARRKLRATVAALRPHVDAGLPVVGLEPSCTAVLRSDLTELLPDDPDARRLAAATRTFAEFLTDIGWHPPDLAGTHVLAQPHCHQHAVMGFHTDSALLQRAGATVDTDTGCCGLAGNFGMERGHYDVSIAVAQNGFLPSLTAADADTVFLADGFSCRTQAQHLAPGRPALHLAELLSERLPTSTSPDGNDPKRRPRA
jgi:FAD/FMN-containing dehydrogenase/Fe-S oxidoreductase